MLKIQEKEMAGSCWNKAKDHERVFVLLGRDPAAPTAIRAWVRWRISRGKNKPDDAQITEALKCADQMERGE